MFIGAVLSKSLQCWQAQIKIASKQTLQKLQEQKQYINIFMDKQDCTTQSIVSNNKNRSWSLLQDRKMNLFLILCYHRLYQQQSQLEFEQNSRRKPNNRLKFNFFLEMGQFVGDRTNKQCRTHFDRKVRDKKYHQKLETYIMKKCFNTFKIGVDNVQDLIRKLKNEVIGYLKEKKNQPLHGFLLAQFQHNVRIIHDKCLQNSMAMVKTQEKNHVYFSKQEIMKVGINKDKINTEANLHVFDDFNYNRHTGFDIDDFMSSGCDEHFVFNHND